MLLLNLFKLLQIKFQQWPNFYRWLINQLELEEKILTVMKKMEVMSKWQVHLDKSIYLKWGFLLKFNNRFML